MGTKARTADAVREKLADVEHWMSMRELPAGLRNQIRDFYTDVSGLGGSVVVVVAARQPRQPAAAPRDPRALRCVA